MPPDGPLPSDKDEIIKRLRKAGRELANLAEEANGDPDSCSYNVPLGERVKELRKVFK